MSENDQQFQKAMPDKPSPTTNQPTNQEKESKIEDKNLTELNGELGYFVKRGTQLVPVLKHNIISPGEICLFRQELCQPSIRKLVDCSVKAPILASTF